MWESRKALDLRRDPRFAVHSGSADPPDWDGDAKLSGRVVEIVDPERHAAALGHSGHEQPEGSRAHVFRADITELSVVRFGDPADHLVIEVWREGRGVTRMTRA